jgi:glycosyltransferase involved in cell wall biosynthesis
MERINIVIAHDSRIPVSKYGGTERDIWYLGHEFIKMGHKVTFLVKEGSVCPFADVKIMDHDLPLSRQIPENTDIINFHYQPKEPLPVPFLVSIHGNLPAATSFYLNTNFVSKNHATRYGADAYVYNGLDWDDYGIPDLKKNENYVHFLGKAAWRVKNVRGAIKIARENKTEIKVLGGSRINLKMGPRITFSKWATFYGMIGGQKKNELLRHSKGLLFPVLWHEPFGLALIESLYFGCPVLGTPFGSLPEIITSEVGFLSNSMNDLKQAFQYLGYYKRKICHEYAVDIFNSKVMAKHYLKLYETILNGGYINKKAPCFNPVANVVPPFE